MIRTSSLKWPIALGVVLLSLLVALLVFWIIGQATTGHMALLAIGTVFFGIVLAGVVGYLVLTVQQVQLTRRQANFIDAVTHELKSPIASIKLCLQTLDMRRVSQEQQQEFHKFMLEDLQRLDSLIDHLLAAARLDSFEEEPLQYVDVEALLRTCIAALVRRYALAEDQIQLDLQPCAAHVRPRDLEMILNNLLDNAAKYAGDPAKLAVEVAPRSANRIVIRVSDNGKGIRFELRRKIFERFVRGGSELERTTKGTGLGLYLVRSLVSKLKGRISVHSRGPLRGATFEVELPGHRVELPVAEEQAPADVQPSQIAST